MRACSNNNMHNRTIKDYSEDEDEDEDEEEKGFNNITYVIVVVYFTTIESLIMYRNTRPCYVSKMAYSCCIREF